MDRMTRIYLSVFTILIIIVAGSFSYIISKSIGYETTEVTWDKYLSSDMDDNGVIYILANRYHRTFIGTDKAKEFIKEQKWGNFPDNGNHPGKGTELFLIKYSTATGEFEQHRLKKDLYLYSGAIKKNGNDLYVFWVQQERNNDGQWYSDVLLNWGKIDEGYLVHRLGTIERSTPIFDDLRNYIGTVAFFPNSSTALISSMKAMYKVDMTGIIKIPDQAVYKFRMDEEGHIHYLVSVTGGVRYHELGTDFLPMFDNNITVDFKSDIRFPGIPEVILLNNVPSLFTYNYNQTGGSSMTAKYYCSSLNGEPVNISADSTIPFDIRNNQVQYIFSNVQVYGIGKNLVLVEHPGGFDCLGCSKQARVYDASNGLSFIKNGTLTYHGFEINIVMTAYGAGNDYYFISQEFHWALAGKGSQITVQKI